MVERGDVRVGAVGRAVGQPVDLVVAGGGADGGDGLRADEGVLVGEERDGDVAVVGAVGRRGVALAAPGVGLEVDRAAGDPGEDVGGVVGRGEAGEGAVGAAHAAHGLVARAVGGVLVGDFDAVHGLRLGVEPDRAVVFCAHAGVGDFVRGFKCDAGVVATSPCARCSCDALELAPVVDILDAITVVALGPSGIVCDDEVSAV